MRHLADAMVNDLMALCDQLGQQLCQADQQRRRLLEAVFSEALVDDQQGSESALVAAMRCGG